MTYWIIGIVSVTCLMILGIIAVESIAKILKYDTFAI